MATPEQLAASRSNATHSTGPVTEAGKEISSRNALKHGLTSKALIVAGEDPADFEALRTDTVAALGPVNEYERVLAENVAVALWRFRRVQRYESAFWQLHISLTEQALAEAGDPALHPDVIAAGLFLDPLESRSVALVHRYLTAAERACSRATNAFEKARKSRSEARPQPAGPETETVEKSTDEMTDQEFIAYMDSLELPGIPSMNAGPQPVPPPVAALTGFVSQKSRTERRAEARARRKAERKARRQRPEAA